MNPPPRFWLKSEKGLLVQVSTVGYENDNVGKFVDAIVTSKVRRAQLGLPEGPDRPTLHIMETADPLCDDLPLAEILEQPGYGENSAKKPLMVIMKVKQQSKRQRQRREESSSFGLSGLFLENSGLEMKLPRTLFCRPEFWKQFEFLDMVLHSPRPEARDGQNPYYNGWILASPGTGKSKTTLAFMSTIDRVHWAITWIHLSSVGVGAACYQIVDNDNRILHRRRLESAPDHIKRIILEEPDVDRHHIMVVDGIWNDEPHRQVRSFCLEWVAEKYEERRLVFVSSMASRGKVKPVEDSRFGAEEFAVDSWNLDDYIHAVKNDDFYNDIQEMLDASGCENLRSREDLLKS
ncbi:unnamed protein product [Calypogeia fissa]